MSMIGWDECHIDWSEDGLMTRITHQATGVYIEPGVACDGMPGEDGVSVRDKQLKLLGDAVEAAE